MEETGEIVMYHCTPFAAIFLEREARKKQTRASAPAHARQGKFSTRAFVGACMSICLAHAVHGFEWHLKRIVNAE